MAKKNPKPSEAKKIVIDDAYQESITVKRVERWNEVLNDLGFNDYIKVVINDPKRPELGKPITVQQQVEFAESVPEVDVDVNMNAFIVAFTSDPRILRRIGSIVLDIPEAEMDNVKVVELATAIVPFAQASLEPLKSLLVLGRTYQNIDMLAILTKTILSGDLSTNQQ
jgi:hypothetical protein